MNQDKQPETCDEYSVSAWGDYEKAWSLLDLGRSIAELETELAALKTVQMPEPTAFIQTDIVEDEETMPVNHELIWPIEKDTRKNQESLYTEQQVRQLLAAYVELHSLLLLTHKARLVRDLLQ